MKTDGDGVGVGGDFYVISVDFYEIDDKLMNIERLMVLVLALVGILCYFY